MNTGCVGFCLSISLVSVASCPTNPGLPVPLFVHSASCFWSVALKAASPMMQLPVVLHCSTSGATTSQGYTRFSKLRTCVFSGHMCGERWLGKFGNTFCGKNHREGEYCLWNCRPTLFFLSHYVVTWNGPNVFLHAVFVLLRLSCFLWVRASYCVQREEVKSPRRSLGYCQFWVMIIMTHSGVALVVKRFCEEAHCWAFIVFFHIQHK